MPIYIRDQGQLAQLSNPAYKGEDGEAGAVPNLQIGSTSASVSQQTIVSISGDKENPVIDFVIPAGDRGDRGLFVGKTNNAPIDAKVVIDNESSPHDLFFKDSTVDYMGEECISLKEKGDSDVEYILRKIGTQHYEGSSVTATNTYAMQVKSAILKGQTLANIVETNAFGSSAILYEYRFRNNRIEDGNKLTIFVTNSNITAIRAGRSNISSNAWVGEVTYDVSTTKRIVHTVRNGEYCSYVGVVVEKHYDSTGYEDGLVILKGDQSHLNITEYFEGVKSVKIPTLTVTNADLTKSHVLTALSDLELLSNENVYDELDLITGKLTQRIGEDGNVLTQPIIKTIDLKNQKIYSYDGTTHYTTSSLQGHLNPILSIDVPTNITSLIRYQQNIINQQRLILSEREEMQNILIDSTLSRYEQTLLTATHISEEEVPNYIQKLYEVAYKRGIRIKEGEI